MTGSSKKGKSAILKLKAKKAAEEKKAKKVAREKALKEEIQGSLPVEAETSSEDEGVVEKNQDAVEVYRKSQEIQKNELLSRRRSEERLMDRDRRRGPQPGSGGRLVGDGFCLEIEQLTRKKGHRIILEDMDLVLPSGHVLGLLGPSGSGKTSLLKVIAGLSRYRGTVKIMGINPGRETKKLVSYLGADGFLSGHETLDSLTFFYKRYFGNFNEGRFQELLKAMDIPGDLSVRKLPLGIRRRLEHALVLSRDAALYLLDEPLTGLDPVDRDEVVDMILDRINDRATMIIAGQQIKELERVFDLVCFLKEGKIEKYGPAEGLRMEHRMTLDALYKKIYRQGGKDD